MEKHGVTSLSGFDVREPALVTVAQVFGFDEIIDVRSEGEFAADHICGAVNCPVLDDAQRARVGTIYKQRSPFEARKIGAALVGGNIARHIEERFLDRPRGWRPLVYCWRGGQRSAAFAHVLAEIGWPVGRLGGGYRAYRQFVREELTRLPAAFRWRVVCGLTGAGKSRLLRALRAAGGQVLDLEALAAHRGSVLGDLPGEPQPPQKLFESMLWSQIVHFTTDRPVYVEAESRRIGEIKLPDALISAMWDAECVMLEAPLHLRVALLKQEYAHFLLRPDALASSLERLTRLYGHTVIERWKELSVTDAWDELTEELLAKHYDPAYARAIAGHYAGVGRAVKLELRDASDRGFSSLAQQCLSRE
jgi:tRNA 2-selenouridine synthase